MKHLIKFLIAPNFINPTLCGARIPVNPILGETYQREMPDGTKLYMEQICHRPQISAFLLEDPDGDYSLSGSYEIRGWINGVNSIQGQKRSNNIQLKLKDGTLYTWTYPTLFIYNISVGGQYQQYMDKVEIVDRTNNIKAQLHYNPHSDNTYGGMLKRGLSFMGKKKAPVKEEDKPKKGDDILIEVVKEVVTPDAKKGP